MYASWYNIWPEYENNKLKISKDGSTYTIITFPSGVYDFDDLKKSIQEKIGKIGGSGSNKDKYGITILFD